MVDEVGANGWGQGSFGNGSRGLLGNGSRGLLGNGSRGHLGICDSGCTAAGGRPVAEGFK